MKRDEQLHKDGDDAKEFLRDLTPFLYGKAVTYVDIGAHHGNVLKALRRTPLYVRHAHLIEANRSVFAVLAAAVSNEKRGRYLHLHNVAIGRSIGTLMMIDEGGMSHVVKPSDGDQITNQYPVESIPLDEFARQQNLKKIHLLKIDVEGFELEVLEGAAGLLRDEKVDVIYIEAGFSASESSQQTYYRPIEDCLQKFGYKIFRIYEQTHEWPEDRAELRRVNLAFMSERFLKDHPFKITNELFRTKQELKKLKKSGLRRAVSKLTLYMNRLWGR